MMSSSEITDSTEDLILEFNWLEKLLHKRVSGNYNSTHINIYSLAPPDLGNTSAYASFITDNQLSFEERVLLILALAPHLNPEFLEVYITANSQLQFYKSPEFLSSLLGTRGQAYKGLLPTGLTYLYILAGNNIRERIRLQRLLSTMAKPQLQKAVTIMPHNLGEPAFSGRLLIVEDYLELFTIGITDKNASIKYAFVNETKN